MATQRPPQKPAAGATSGPQQPGPRQRILRIGVLLGGKIVEERLIRERVPVSVGQSMKNTFSIPIEGLPLEFTLFALDEGRYSLRFLNKMDGRLSDSGGQVNTLDALKAKGAGNHGDYWQVPLSDSARGKLSFGDLTILFQFVTEPPRQPKPMLPASVRGTFADRFEPQLLVILGASIMLHFIMVIAAFVGPWADIERDSMAEKAYELTFEPEKVMQPEVQEVEVAEAGSAAGSAEAPKPDKQPAKNPATPAKDPGGGRKETTEVALQEDDAAAFADKLTSESTTGTDQGDMSKRRPGADLGAQIDNVRDGNRQVSVGGGANRGPRGDGSVKIGDGKGPKTDGPGGIESAGGGKQVEKGPTGRITVGPTQTFDESSLTADIILRKIQTSYMNGLKRCYKTYLNSDASARGKVTLTLPINPTGRVVGGRANGFAGEVDACISALMGSWIFPAPKDKDGEATEANFAITLQLVPD